MRKGLALLIFVVAFGHMAWLVIPKEIAKNTDVLTLAINSLIGIINQFLSPIGLGYLVLLSLFFIPIGKPPSA